MTHTSAINKMCRKLAGPVFYRLQWILIRLSLACRTFSFNILLHSRNSRAEFFNRPSRQGFGFRGSYPDGTGTVESRTGSQEKLESKEPLPWSDGPDMLAPFPSLSSRNQETLNSFTFLSCWCTGSLTPCLLLLGWPLVTWEGLGKNAMVCLSSPAPRGSCWPSV